MDKKATFSGLIRLNKTDFKNSVKQESHNIPRREECEHFAIDAKEFPSLAEVSDEKGRQNKSPLDSSKSCFSYSDKVKSIPQEPRSNLKVETAHENLSKSGYVSNKAHSSKEKSEPFKRDKAHQRLNCDIMEANKISNKEQTKRNFTSNPSDRHDNRHKLERKSYTFESTNEGNGLNNQLSDKRPSFATKNRASFKTLNQYSEIETDSNQSQSTKSVGSSSVHTSSNDEHISRTKVQHGKQSKENSLNKTSYSQITNRVKGTVPDSSHNHTTKDLHNRIENIKTDNIVNNTSTNKTNTSAHKSQIVIGAQGWNCSESQNNYSDMKLKQMELPVVVAKKKRKSKLKRQVAMQTGKIFVLTPEAHSKILNQTSTPNTKAQKNVITDINDSKEYPELGSTMIPKSNKDYLVKTVEVSIKKDMPTLSDENEVSIRKTDPCFEISENVSPNIENIEASCVKDQEKITVESTHKEKSSAHTKDPITISLFDMLLSAKSKKKELDKKNEVSSEDSPSKAVKNSSRSSTKKAISQFVNPLDSSRPAVKRGKEREKPKVKRPSRMRKLILMGRKLRRDELALEDDNQMNNAKCVVPSEDIESSLKLHGMDKNSFFVELCSGDENEFSTFDENDEVDNMIRSTELRDYKRELLMKVEYQDTSLQDQCFPSCSLNESEEDFSSDCGRRIVTMEGKSSSQNVSDSQYIHNPKESASLKNAEKSFSVKVSSKPCISNRLAAQFLGNSVLYNDEHTIQSSQSPTDSDYVFQEVKCVLENILLHVEGENKSSMSFETKENNMNCTLIVEEYALEDNISELRPNLKNSEEDINSCKPKYHSFSKDNIDKNELFKNDVFYNVTENSNVPSFDSFEATSDDSGIIKSAIKNELDDTDTVSNYNKHYLNKSFDSDTSSKNKNILITSLKSNLNGNKTVLEKSSATPNPGEITSNITNSSKQEESDNCISIFSDQEKLEAVKILLHTRKFRQYCNHFISKEIDTVVFALLDDLARFQDRMHQKDPVKARIRKRLLYGIKEITRHMKLKKLKCIILATDIEDIKTKGGLNDVIKEIISLAEAHLIPYIFSHRRFNLGKVCRKAVPVSCVGIFNYEGSEKNFKQILELQAESKHDYTEVTRTLMSVLTHSQIAEIFKLSKGSPERIYELRALVIKEHFSPILNENENKFEISTIVKSENCNENEEVKNPSTNADFESCNLSLVNEKLVSLIKGDITISKELNKNEIYNSLKKYNLM